MGVYSGLMAENTLPPESSLYLLGAGSAHPETVIDNAFLESLDIGTTNEWILERVGIHTRRTILPLDYIRHTRNSDPREASKVALSTGLDLGVAAAHMALQRAQIEPGQVGMVIAGTSVPPLFIPALACALAARLGIAAPAFDLNSACSTFSAQLHFLHQLKELPDFILLIQAETYTAVTNYNDRNTAVLWGDGASAQVFSPRISGKARVGATAFASDPSGYAKVTIPAYGHFTQEGSVVQRFAITKTVEIFQKLQEKNEQKDSSLYFIGHQANLRALESICERAAIDRDKHYYNVHTYGNCGASGGPSVLSENWERFKPGTSLALVTVGAGLSWGGALLHFGK